MKNHLMTIAVLAGLACLLASCRKEEVESDSYLEWMASTWGIGVTLGMNRETVEGILDSPDFEEQGRNKLTTDLIWIPEQVSAHGLTDSQLRLTFTEDELTSMLCLRKEREDEEQVIYDPPYLIKLAAGCTIGGLKSDFMQKLGPATSERSDSLIWDHQSITGNRLRITVVFEMDEKLGTAVCQSIAVQTGKPLGESMAEDKK